MPTKSSTFSTEFNLKNLFSNAKTGLVIHSWDTSIVYANPIALNLLRLTQDQILGRSSFDPQWHFVDQSGKILDTTEYPVNKVKKSNVPIMNETLGVVDGSTDDISWFSVNAYKEQGNSDSASFIIITFDDLSATQQHFSFKDIVENSKDVVVVTEAHPIDKPLGPKIVYVNEAFETLTGYKAEEVIGETPRILQGPLTSKEATNRIKAALAENKPVTETIINYDRMGRAYWIEMNIVPLLDQDGNVSHFAAIERDVSERKFHLEQLEAKNRDLKELKQIKERRVAELTTELKMTKVHLEQIAFVDQLTNLPNRRYFIDQAAKVIYLAQRQKQLVAFGFIDVDNFKLLNDTYGHGLGDEVLKAIAKSFNQSFRTQDAYCRYGGEEFAFAVMIASLQDAEQLAKRLVKQVQDLEVISECGNSVKFTVSLGVKVTEASKSTDFELEINEADEAMYEAKHNGKNQYVVVS